MLPGLRLLKGSDQIEFLGLDIGSQHRNQTFVQCLAMILAGMGDNWQNRWDDLMPDEDIELLNKITDLVGDEAVDVVITAAGWANHLTGCIDAFLRYTLGAKQPWVIGVALEDPSDSMHTLAAQLSISEVPGTKVIYSCGGVPFIGSEGFSEACQYAISNNPYPNGVPEPDPAKRKPPAFFAPDEIPDI